MIKLLIQKALYPKEYSETKEMLWKLLSRQHIIQILCLFIIPFNFVLSLIPIFIIDLCENVQLAISTKVLICIFVVIYGLCILFVIKFFTDAIFLFSRMISWKIYYFLYTRRGKALSKYDLKTIKNNNKDLFDFISSKMCRGYCYSICFSMLKLLEKGTIEYIAVRNIIPDDDEASNEKKPFTMHVLYVNNDYAFDTYCQRQIPLEKILRIYNAKVFRIFSFNDIKDVSYDDFRKNLKEELHSWCEKHECSENFSNDLEET